MSIYVDCTNHTLRDAVREPWFDHSWLRRDTDDNPLERQAFLARFSVDRQDVSYVRQVARLLRANRGSSTFQRAFLDKKGMVERLSPDEYDRHLFFPREGKDADSGLTNVSLIRVPAAVGGTLTMATVSLKERDVAGRHYDIRLPGPMLALADNAALWNEVYDDESGMQVQRQFQLLYRVEPASCVSFNPAVFYEPLVLNALIDRNMGRTYAPRFFSASLVMQLIQYHARPFTGEEATDVHSVLLGMAQQADFGIECYDATRGDVSALQQYMNALLLFVLVQAAQASSIRRPFTASAAVAEFSAMLLAIGAKPMILRVLMDDGQTLNPLLATDEPLVGGYMDALFDLMRFETQAMAWRLLGGRDLGRALDTPACHFLFALLLLRSTMLYLGKLDSATDAGRKTRGFFLDRLEDALTALKDAISDRFACLLRAYNDALRETTALLGRYGAEAANYEQVRDWMMRRTILRGSLLHLDRLYEQLYNCRDYFHTVRDVLDLIGPTDQLTSSNIRDVLLKWKPRARQTAALEWQFGVDDGVQFEVRAAEIQTYATTILDWHRIQRLMDIQVPTFISLT